MAASTVPGRRGSAVLDPGPSSSPLQVVAHRGPADGGRPGREVVGASPPRRPRTATGSRRSLAEAPSTSSEGVTARRLPLALATASLYVVSPATIASHCPPLVAARAKPGGGRRRPGRPQRRVTDVGLYPRPRPARRQGCWTRCTSRSPRRVGARAANASASRPSRTSGANGAVISSARSADTRGSPTDTPCPRRATANGIAKTGCGAAPRNIPEYNRLVGGARSGPPGSGPVDPSTSGSLPLPGSTSSAPAATPTSQPDAVAGWNANVCAPPDRLRFVCCRGPAVDIPVATMADGRRHHRDDREPGAAPHRPASRA